MLDDDVANIFIGGTNSVSLTDDGKTIALGEISHSAGGREKIGRVRVFNIIQSATAGRVNLRPIGQTITGEEASDVCGGNVKVFNENRITVYYSCDKESGSESSIIKRATLTDGLASVWSIEEFVIPRPATGADRDFTIGNKAISFASNAFRLAIGNPFEDVRAIGNAGRVRVFQNDKLSMERELFFKRHMFCLI